VRLCFGTRGSGSDATPWTEIEAELPPSYPLEVHVRRRTRLDEPIDRRDVHALGFGAPAFDQTFVVEAAPEDVVRLLLDAGAQRMLSAHEVVTLDTESDGARRVLRLAIRTWVEDVSDALFAMDRVARICAGVRNAYALLDSAVPVQMDGAPYRPVPNDESARAVSDERAAEVVALRTLRAQREHRQAVTAMVLFRGGRAGLPDLVALATAGPAGQVARRRRAADRQVRGSQRGRRWPWHSAWHSRQKH
jgi:hypothetical protein